MNERDIPRSTARRLTRTAKKTSPKRVPKDAASDLSAIAAKAEKFIPKPRPGAIASLAMERSALPTDTETDRLYRAQADAAQGLKAQTLANEFGVACLRARSIAADDARHLPTFTLERAVTILEHAALACREEVARRAGAEVFCGAPNCMRTRTECERTERAHGLRCCTGCTHEPAKPPACPRDATHLVEPARNVPAWCCSDCGCVFVTSSSAPALSVAEAAQLHAADHAEGCDCADCCELMLDAMDPGKRSR